MTDQPIVLTTTARELDAILRDHDLAQLQAQADQPHTDS
jgi:hypothetical protein